MPTKNHCWGYYPFSAARQHGEPRAMDPKPGNREQPEIIFNHLMECIGLALDLKGGRMFITDLAGSVYSANLDGSNKKTLLVAEGNLTGIAYVELPGRALEKSLVN